MIRRIPAALGDIDLRFVERDHPAYLGIHMHTLPPTIRVLQWRMAMLADHQHQLMDFQIGMYAKPALMWSPWFDVRTEDAAGNCIHVYGPSKEVAPGVMESNCLACGEPPAREAPKP